MFPYALAVAGLSAPVLAAGYLLIVGLELGITLILSPYGRRSTGKETVILARRTAQDTDHDYIAALAVSLHIKRTITDSVAPMVTADTYFACDSMKAIYTNKSVCVIVFGPEALH